MSEFWINILVTLVVGTLLFYWQERVKKKLEREGKELQADLDKVVNESNVRFSQAYSIRTVAMRELYKKLVQTESALKKFITPGSSFGKNEKDELRENTKASITLFEEFYFQNAILFNVETCTSIEKIIELLNEIYFGYGIMKDIATTVQNEKKVELQDDFRKKCDLTFQKLIPNLKNNLKKTFRAEFGIT